MFKWFEQYSRWVPLICSINYVCSFAFKLAEEPRVTLIKVSIFNENIYIFRLANFHQSLFSTYWKLGVAILRPIQHTFPVHTRTTEVTHA